VAREWCARREHGEREDAPVQGKRLLGRVGEASRARDKAWAMCWNGWERGRKMLLVGEDTNSSEGVCTGQAVL
jgi:hypothetical protein